MLKLKLEEIIKITQGQLNKEIDDMMLDHIEIDSRSVNKKSYFMPILGEIHDGHKFIVNAFKAGTGMSFCEKAYYYSHYELLKEYPLILVDNTTKTLHRLASYILEVTKVKKIGITGSVGKTSTKEFVFHVLKEKYNVHKNKGNFNNHIGMPLTIFNLEEQHDIVILEMGMNHFKEIETLVDVARPDIGVVTNIGTSHIGILGSQENIFQAKMEMTSYFDQENTLIVNGLDPYLKKVQSDVFEVMHVGEQLLVAKKINIQDNGCYAFEFEYDQKSYAVRLNVLGKHNIINSLLAVAVGLKCDVEMVSIIKGIEAFEDNEKRLELYKGLHNNVIISDCYNASQESMISAIEVLNNTKSKYKVAVLGDVLELGEFARSSHENVGVYIQENPVDLVVTYGKDSRYIIDKAVEMGFDSQKTIHFSDQYLLIEYLEKQNLKETTILVKGSLGMNMLPIVKSLSIQE